MKEAKTSHILSFASYSWKVSISRSNGSLPEKKFPTTTQGKSPCRRVDILSPLSTPQAFSCSLNISGDCANPIPREMEKPKHGMVIVCAAILLLGLISAMACIAAEFKRTKAKDVRLDGKLCSLPGSPAFGLGLAASICLLAAQVVGTSAIGWQLCSREKKPSTNDRRKATAIILFILSWITFGFAIVLLGVASSMNHSQRYGDGWLNGQCYVVNDGVYIGAAVLVLAAVIFILGFTFTARMTYGREQVDQGRRVHAQKQGEIGKAGDNCKQ